MLERSQLASIHIAAKEAGLSDTAYRELLQRVAGVSSSSHLSDDGYQAVMRALRDITFSRERGASSPPKKTPAERKIWALWLGSDQGPGLRSYLAPQQRNVAYLLGFIRAAAGLSDLPGASDLSDLSASQARRAIEALKQRLAPEIAKYNAKTESIPF